MNYRTLRGKAIVVGPGDSKSRPGTNNTPFLQKTDIPA